jgi:hypothetical protein
MGQMKTDQRRRNFRKKQEITDLPCSSALATLTIFAPDACQPFKIGSRLWVFSTIRLHL